MAASNSDFFFASSAAALASASALALASASVLLHQFLLFELHFCVGIIIKLFSA
jgi:hypothetical protein